MHAYRFRILIEDVDEFYRDIEIMASSTFVDFHKAICEAVNFDGSELASFYICDSKWNRKREITLEDMSEEGDENAPLVMSKCKLAEYIDDPHQRMIYIYDFINMYEFYIELFKIIPVEKKIKYPRCVKKSGNMPMAGSIIAPRSTIFDEEEVYDVDDALKEEEDDAYGFYTSDRDLIGGIAADSFEDEKF